MYTMCIQLFITLTITLIVLINSVNGSIEINKYLKTCNRNADDANECMEEAVRQGLPLLCDGIPELMIPPIDPYLQDEILVDYNNNQIVAKAALRNVIVHGLKKATVKGARLRAEEDTFHLEVDMKSSRVFVNGQYEVSGGWNSLKVDAKGDFNVSMTGLTYTWKLDGTPIDKDGEKYMKITSFYMRPDLENLKGYIGNENPETKTITDLLTTFSNENWKPLYRELLPVAQNNWNTIGIKIANKIFLKVPYDQLFPTE